MKCAEVRDALDAYDAGELSAPESLRVEEHLAGCSFCQVELDEQRQLAADLRRASGAVVPLRVFSIPSVEAGPHRRSLWTILAAAAVVWAAALTVAFCWPSVASKLTFTPVGQRLSAGQSAPPATGGTGSRSSFGRVPAAALSTATKLFAANGHAREGAWPITPSALTQLSHAVDVQHGSLQVVAVGPVISASSTQVRLVLTVAWVPNAEVSGGSAKRRYEMLVTLSKSTDGQWSAIAISLRPGR